MSAFRRFQAIWAGTVEAVRKRRWVYWPLIAAGKYAENLFIQWSIGELANRSGPVVNVLRFLISAWPAITWVLVLALFVAVLTRDLNESIEKADRVPVSTSNTPIVTQDDALARALSFMDTQIRFGQDLQATIPKFSNEKVGSSLRDAIRSWGHSLNRELQVRWPGRATRFSDNLPPYDDHRAYGYTQYLERRLAELMEMRRELEQ